MNDEANWHETVALSELDDEEPTQVKIGDTYIAICRLEDTAYAIADICSHEHAYLSDGIIENGCVECPLHQALFDIKTGKALTAPATEDVSTFPVKIIDGVIWVNI